MSNFTDRQKNLFKKQLAKFRNAILNDADPEVLRKQVKILERHLQDLKEVSTGELKATVETTLKKIQEFWLHDTTRFEVCRWVQTIICELNQI